MAYEYRKLGRQKVLYNNTNDDNPLTYQLVVNGAKVTPTSATIAVYKPGSTTAVQAATAMTLSGSLLTYTLDTTASTTNYSVGTGYRAEIVVTYSTETYNRHLTFDIVKFLLDLNIGFDQIVAFDDGIRGMTWDGDEDFSELINAFRDEIQMRLEAKVLDDEKLIENVIIDHSAVAVCARYGILAQLWRAKKDYEAADYYRGLYESSLRTVLSSLKYDRSQSGEEGSMGGIQEVRLVL